MKREVITPSNVPAVVAPYSQAIRVGDLVFTAGQIGLSPSTGKLVEGGIEQETRQTLLNLAGVLEAADSSLDKVVKTTVFLKNWGDFQTMNQIYVEFFAKDPPARSTIEVVGLALGAAVFFYVQAVAEERFCRRELGPEYDAYVERVPRFNFLLGLIKVVREHLHGR